MRSPAAVRASSPLRSLSPAFAAFAAALLGAAVLAPAALRAEPVKSLKQAQEEAAQKKAASAAAAGAAPATAPSADAAPATRVILPGSAAPAPASGANRVAIPPPPPIAAKPAAAEAAKPAAADAKKDKGAAKATAAPAVPAAPTAGREVEVLLAEAGAAEKANQCEAAYGKYQAALEKVGKVTEKVRGAELESIVQNKLDKLDDCYKACQPNGRQRSLFESAQGALERGEPKRAVQIARKLLTGKDQRCVFWGGVKEFLSKFPNQADELANDKVDPCEVTPEVTAQLEAARSGARRQQQQLADLLADRSKLAEGLDPIIELFRSLDQARQKVFEMREEFLDCDAVYRPLVEDAAKLRDASDQAQSAIVASYKAQLDVLAKKVRVAQSQVAERNRALVEKGADLNKLKAQLEEINKINEDLFNDLFNIAGTEAVSFTTQIEGRRVQKPMEEIRALVADEGKVLAMLQSKYPEFFADGTNVEGLRRKKLVLEKIGQMLSRFGKAKGEAHPGYQRALDEVDATVKMIDKAMLAKGSEAKAGAAAAGGEKKEEGGVPGWLVGLGGVLAVGGLVFWRIKASSKPDTRGLRD